MNLQITYDPETDTLDIGNGLPGSDGHVIADRLTAFFDADEDVVSVTLENAVEVLGPYLSRYIAVRSEPLTASVLRDEGTAT